MSAKLSAPCVRNYGGRLLGQGERGTERIGGEKKVDDESRNKNNPSVVMSFSLTSGQSLMKNSSVLLKELTLRLSRNNFLRSQGLLISRVFLEFLDHLDRGRWFSYINQSGKMPKT